MSIAAAISSTEITTQVTNRFSGKTFEAILLNAPSVTYQPGITNDATFLGYEVAYGTGGYARQVISYSGGDISAYTDDGVGLATKVAIFGHDNGVTPINFSHTALLWGNGNVNTLSGASSKPASGVNGTYTNLPTTTNGSGKGLTVNLTVTGNGSSLSGWTLTIVKKGYGYVAGDSLEIQNSALQAVGATTVSGNLVFGVSTATTGGGQILCVAKTASSVVLTGGNEAVFNFNLKQYGFAS